MGGKTQIWYMDIIFFLCLYDTLTYLKKKTSRNPDSKLGRWFKGLALCNTGLAHWRGPV